MKKSKDGKGQSLYTRMKNRSLLLLQISEKERKRAKMMDQVTILIIAGAMGMLILMVLAYFIR